MTYEIVMPQLGLTMTEGSVSTWLKKPGEWVEKGEMLFTVQTDKVEMEVECFGSGYLSDILVENELVVPVGTLLATLRQEAAALPMTEGKSAASPRARKIAKELGVDLATVRAAGSRISEEDVRRHFEQSGGVAPKPPAAVEAPASTARKITARRMTESFTSAPHFYLGVEANAAALTALREELNSDGTGKPKLTFTDFFLKAMAEALREQPGVNAFWNGDGVTRRDRIDIGCAVQTDDSLVVPVIRNADNLDLHAVAERRAELVQKARTRTLVVSDMEGGSATLSNLGTSGIDWFQAILNPPQSVILAVGRIAARPVVVGNQLQVQPTVHMNLSADHRVLDGAAAAAFLSRIQQLIEHPQELLAART
ncbi:MAG: dihydrolipoamide acetyltransferase family protein [Bryobacteraceae bacterium]